MASAELRFETSSDGVPLAVLTKGEVPMMRVVAELMIAANAAVATRVFAHTPAYAFVRRHGEFIFVSVRAISYDVVFCCLQRRPGWTVSTS